MVMVIMPSSKVVSFFVLTVVSMSHTVISSEMTNDTPEYAVTELATEHLTFQWTLKNYSLLSREETECFSSPYFHTKSHDVQWLLTFCPSDSHNSYSGTINLISHSSKPLDNNGFAIDGQISIFKAGIFLREQTFSKKIRLGEELLSNFYDASEIDNLSDSADEMNIRCDFDVKRIISKRIDVTEQKIVHEPQEGKLNDDFGRLLKEEKFSDVDIIVEDEKLSAHELILATRSSVFADLFEQMERNDNGKLQVIIENREPAVMKAILEYLYTDYVTNLDEFPSMFGLLSAADEFKLPQLKIMCESVLNKRLDADSAADILVFTDRYGLNKLKKDAMKFIRNHFPDVMETEGYKKMKDKYPALLMEILFSATDKRF